MNLNRWVAWIIDYSNELRKDHKKSVHPDQLCLHLPENADIYLVKKMEMKATKTSMVGITI